MHRKHVLEVASSQVQASSSSLLSIQSLAVEAICGCGDLLGKLRGRHICGWQAVLKGRGLAHGELGPLSGFAQESAAGGLLTVPVGILSLKSLQVSDAVTSGSLRHRQSIYLHLLMCL